MTSSDIHTASCFFKRWLIFFRIKDSSPPWFDQESAPVGLQKFPMKGGKASFIKRIAGTFGLLKILVMIFFFVDFFHQFGMVKRLHLIFLRVFSVAGA